MRVEELERELRAERPEPEPDFARRLDEWAAAGFPRDRGLGPHAGGAARRGAGLLGRAWDRLGSTPPRRVLMPVGAAATLLVVGGVVISQLSNDVRTGLSEQAQPAGDAAAPSGAGGRNGGGQGELEFFSGESKDAAGTARSSAEAEQALSAPPDETLLPAPIPDRGGGGIARGTESRLVDATARITLGAEADEVQEVANDVVEVTDRHDGVVLDSQVTTDQAGARAAFTLEIPFKELDAALTDLSGLADVISRTEAGEDITARAVRARKDLARLFEQVREARIELIRADTREERLIVKSRIRSLEAQADAAEAELNNVKRLGRFATVSVDVTSNGPDSDEGAWTLGDALDDAGRVIEVIGGVLLITLAVLVPLAFLAALAWLIAARARRYQREQALDA